VSAAALAVPHLEAPYIAVRACGAVEFLAQRPLRSVGGAQVREVVADVLLPVAAGERWPGLGQQSAADR
jgi:hypothetical protein